MKKVYAYKDYKGALGSATYIDDTHQFRVECHCSNRLIVSNMKDPCQRVGD